MNGTPNKYELFLKTVETGNISKAAEMLNYTQSGISHAIQALEKEMGFDLLIRGKTGVRLTEKGKRILPEIQGLVNQQRKLEQAVYDINHKIAGTLRIGGFTSAIALLLPEVLSEFSKEYPEVEIELVDGDYEEISRWIEEGRIDCGFLPDSFDNSGNPDLSAREVFRDEMFAAVSREHELASERSTTVEELIKSPLILQYSGYSHDVNILLKSYKDRLQAKYYLRDDIEVMYLVSQNHGVGFIPELMSRVGNADLKLLSLEPKVYRKINLVSYREQHLTATARVFTEYVVNHFTG